MIKLLNRLLIIMVMLIITTSPALALEKVGTTSFQFLKVMSDARATAMGDAYVAVSSSSDAVFWNPGALTKVEKFDFTFSQMDYFLDVVHYAFSGAYSLGSLGTIGVQGAYADIGEIGVTRVENLLVGEEEYIPGITGETIHPYAMVIGLSYAKKLTDKFSFGLTAKYIREDMDFNSSYMKNGKNVALSSIAFDLGLVYDTGFRSLQLAAAVRHFGPEVSYVNKGYPMPQTFDIGVAGYLMGPGENFGIQSEKQTLLFSADLIQPRDYDQQYHLGLEYGLYNMLFLRAGYKINYDVENFTAGFGLNYSNYRIDYSFANFGEFLDSVHRFSIGINI